MSARHVPTAWHRTSFSSSQCLHSTSPRKKSQKDASKKSMLPSLKLRDASRRSRMCHRNPFNSSTTSLNIRMQTLSAPMDAIHLSTSSTSQTSLKLKLRAAVIEAIVVITARPKANLISSIARLKTIALSLPYISLVCLQLAIRRSTAARRSPTFSAAAMTTCKRAAHLLEIKAPTAPVGFLPVTSRVKLVERAALEELPTPLASSGKRRWPFM